MQIRIIPQWTILGVAPFTWSLLDYHVLKRSKYIRIWKSLGMNAVQPLWAVDTCRRGMINIANHPWSDITLIWKQQNSNSKRILHLSVGRASQNAVLVFTTQVPPQAGNKVGRGLRFWEEKMQYAHVAGRRGTEGISWSCGPDHLGFSGLRSRSASDTLPTLQQWTDLHWSALRHCVLSNRGL